MKGIFIRTLQGLSPDDDNAREALQGLPPGTLVSCEVVRPRNLQHLRLYWKLCATIGDAIGAHRDTVSDVIKLRTGHCVTVQTKKGLHQFPRSISFSKMDQAGFNKFFNDACMVVCEEFIPHMKANDIRNDVLRMAGVPVEEAA